MGPRRCTSTPPSPARTTGSWGATCCTGWSGWWWRRTSPRSLAGPSAAPSTSPWDSGPWTSPRAPDGRHRFPSPRCRPVMPDPEPDPLDRLDPRLVAAVRRRGIAELTEIQRLALPLLHGSSDALLISPTGTGKTEAALLPLLSRQLKDPSPPVSLLYVTPLRALNRDLAVRLTELCQEVGLVAAVRHGDTPAGDRLRQARRPPDLLLTTPETLQLLLVGTRLREGLRGVRAVIVDEVHELAPSDRGAQLALTLERLEAFVGRPIRRIGLSATVGNPEHVARFLSPEPRSVEVRAARQRRNIVITPDIPPPGPPPVPAPLAAELKADAIQLGGLVALEAAIRAHTTTLIFVNTRPTAEGLAARLSRLAPDLAIAVHHGSLSRELREEAEESFRSGKLRALVATSSLELGLDIGHVDLVMQFGSPHQASRLLQRVGRAGHRMGREVRGIVLSLDEEDLEESAVLARRAVSSELEPIEWRTRNRLAVGQQVVAALRARAPSRRRSWPGCSVGPPWPTTSTTPSGAPSWRRWRSSDPSGRRSAGSPRDGRPFTGSTKRSR